MAKIQILPDNLANKIAAGEVVQRPESVVKELMENSIDAGSTILEVYIRRAGKSLIRIVDNGEGMTEEDAVLSIHKHATSKIKEYNDLEEIKTLGFRGEALSSIAAVSQLEIKTKRADEELGTLIKIDDVNGVQVLKVSASNGTVLTVKNLFYNTPARRNFLRTDGTELKHITDTFNKLALSHPEISLSFFVDEHKIYDYPAGTLDERVKDIFGEGVATSLIPVSENTELVNVKGYIGKPTLLKKSKGEQYLFLNLRSIYSKSINHAVINSFENVIEKGEYPFYILFLEIDPRKVDVNIHPSKAEVRFDDERDIYNIISSVIRKGLNSHDLVPSLTFNHMPSGVENNLRFTKYTPSVSNDFSDRPTDSVFGYTNTEPPRRPMQNLNYSDKDIDQIFSSITRNVERPKNPEVIQAPFDFDTPIGQQESSTQNIQSVDLSMLNRKSTPFMVQLHNRYILCQIKSGLMIIDQHVAHERILYEKAKKQLDETLPPLQQLLLPQTVQFDPGSYATLKEINNHLMKLGFQLKFSQKFTVVIEAIPPEIHFGEEEKVLRGIVDEYLTNRRERGLEERDNLAKSFSCKTAIKSGDPLNEEEMRILIDELFASSMPYVCPHGRPIVVKITLGEFDRRFGRT